MARVLSALALLPIVAGTIWYLPPVATVVLAEVVLLRACVEYLALAAAFGAVVPRGLVLAATGVVAAAVAYGTAVVGLTAALLAVGVVSLTAARNGRDLLLDLGASLAPLLYLGVGVGTLAAVRMFPGRGAVLLLLGTVMLSDTAQYYGGRWLGRRPLAPEISPGKTVEGALFGVAAGLAVTVAAGPWALDVSAAEGALLGVLTVGLGIAGDLFESRLKRGAGVKDASDIIPGHGGVLDRIDALLFAGPGFYLFLHLN